MLQLEKKSDIFISVNNYWIMGKKGHLLMTTIPLKVPKGQLNASTRASFLQQLLSNLFFLLTEESHFATAIQMMNDCQLLKKKTPA